ncbi:MAG: aminoglycoside phosphotransferase family protein [Yoonia sp.]|uniref:aminoglycoside phosphotransferase family protein n=1 Tax=Yoonia sp. TaxID=2212373 RepID=UPI003EF0E035
MTDRETQIAGFVGQTAWKDWQRIAIEGDASARRYWRLTDGAQTVILMDDAPEKGGSTVPFAKIAQLLLDQDLCPPHILAHDVDAGLMIISDLGTQDLAAWLRNSPADEMQLYRTATDVLIKLHHASPPADLDLLTAKAGADLLDLVGSHYARRDITDLQSAMRTALDTHAPKKSTLALRDFHAENLIWRPRHQGTDRIGLLDFQDAFIAPAGYDLVSLLRDARRDVGPDTAEAMYAHFAAETGMGPDFKTQLGCIAIQRNLRILGIFGRLSLSYGKPRYLNLIPRVWGHIMTDLADPALADLREAVLDTVPAPTTDILAGLKP